MRRFILFMSIIAVVLMAIVSVASANGGLVCNGSITINAMGRQGTVGQSVVLATAATEPGVKVKFVVTDQNNESVHPGNVLSLKVDGNVVVSEYPENVAHSNNTFEWEGYTGSSVSVVLTFGDTASSFNGTLSMTCCEPVATTSTAPPTTASPTSTTAAPPTSDEPTTTVPSATPPTTTVTVNTGEPPVPATTVVAQEPPAPTVPVPTPAAPPAVVTDLPATGVSILSQMLVAVTLIIVGYLLARWVARRPVDRRVP